MLTWDDLEALCVATAIKLWLPTKLVEVPPDGRALYMLPDVYEEFKNGTWFAPSHEPTARTRERKAALRMVLERYVRGHHLNLDRDIKELGTKYSDASMRGYWEFRSHPPMEETRLFGFFARPGAFVATDFQPRGRFKVRADWSSQRAHCQARWDSLTGSQDYKVSPWRVLLKLHLKEYLER